LKEAHVLLDNHKQPINPVPRRNPLPMIQNPMKADQYELEH
jgi:hypothetical protein